MTAQHPQASLVSMELQMTTKPKIGVIVASIRPNRHGDRPANWIAKIAEQSGLFAAVEVVDLKDYPLPLFDAPASDLWMPTPNEVAAKWQMKLDEFDGFIIVTPEYNHSIPGALKNAIDWASRPWGENSFDHIPAAVIGASMGSIGTAVAQQSLRGVLSFCNARQMTAPEAYIHFTPEVFAEDGTVNRKETEEFLRTFMGEFREHLQRVLTVLPRQESPSG